MQQTSFLFNPSNTTQNIIQGAHALQTNSIKIVSRLSYKIIGPITPISPIRMRDIVKSHSKLLINNIATYMPSKGTALLCFIFIIALIALLYSAYNAVCFLVNKYIKKNATQPQQIVTSDQQDIAIQLLVQISELQDTNVRDSSDLEKDIAKIQILEACSEARQAAISAYNAFWFFDEDFTQSSEGTTTTMSTLVDLAANSAIEAKDCAIKTCKHATKAMDNREQGKNNQREKNLSLAETHLQLTKKNTKTAKQAEIECEKIVRKNK